MPQQGAFIQRLGSSLGQSHSEGLFWQKAAAASGPDTFLCEHTCFYVTQSQLYVVALWS